MNWGSVEGVPKDPHRAMARGSPGWKYDSQRTADVSFWRKWTFVHESIQGDICKRPCVDSPLCFSIHFMLNIRYPRHAGELQTAEGRHHLDLSIMSVSTYSHLSIIGTHNLLDGLNVIIADSNPSRAAQMPTGLQRQILNHDARQHHQLRVDFV